MTHVLVLGGAGMLGSMVASVLAPREGLKVTATARAVRLPVPGVEWVEFDAARHSVAELFRSVGAVDWVVNAIGITKPLVKDNNPAEVERAVRINSVLPHELARATGARVLQIATDCVYSGARGAYVEADAHDATDVYGKTKSLGECWLPNVANLRCSIVGPEPKEYKFLLEWFLGQAQGASLNGFTNHLWNGVTTLAFARICAGVIQAGMALPHLVHVVPEGEITKAALLKEFARCWRRDDLVIRDVAAGTVVDRTLRTSQPELNEALWRAAGYAVTPTVPGMLDELAAFGRPAAVGA